jgi:peptidoglycan/LPS O-acetylase OafA/YrhL
VSRSPQLKYQPALDGLRGVAVAAVLLYHGGVGWSPGGFLGVDIFFVLSGYLITSLLVAEQGSSGSIRLGRFWTRRARRLLPALFCVVAVVVIHAVVVGGNAPGAVPGLGGDVLATLLYVGNWHQIWAGGNYFAVTGPVSPLQHTWSLAIEEQFYLLWPLVILGLGWLFARSGRRARSRSRAHARGNPSRPVLAWAALAALGAIASAIAMDLLYNVANPDRVYFGTDTKAQDLLIGAALAFLLARWKSNSAATTVRRRRLPLEAVAIGCAAIVGLAVVTAAGTSGWLYHFGYLGIDLCVAAVIGITALLPRSAVGSVLSVRPLRWPGIISYGVYLWHFPLFLWLDEASTGLSGTGLFALRVVVTVAVATVSFFLIEKPFRTGHLPRLATRALIPAGVAAGVACVLLASSVTVAGLPGLEAASLASPDPLTSSGLSALAGGSGAQSMAGSSGSSGSSGSVPAPGPSAMLPRSARAAVNSTTTPLRVLLVGDSIALTLGFYQGKYVKAQFGANMVDEGFLGCGFVTAGDVVADGLVYPERQSCAQADQTWSSLSKRMGAQAVVVEMGYWDCFDRIIDGVQVHVGEPAYDRLVVAGIGRFVRLLGARGVRIVFLTVPPVDPPPLADGSPQPSADPQRWSELNGMLAATAAQHPGRVALVDIGRIVAPGGTFAATLNGQPCRWSDGIHFMPYCGRIVQPAVFSAVNKLLSD